MPLSDREILSIVDSEFSSSLGIDGETISTERAKAYDYYLQKPDGNEIEGHSKVVSSDVAETVDSLIPSLLRIFASADNLVFFEPVGVEDVKQATQETEYVNYVFFKRNPAFMILYNWFFDALVQKNGIVKCWVDVSERVTTEQYRGIPEAELLVLLEDDELTPLERGETISDTGEVLHDIDFTRVVKTPTIKVDNVPPEEYRISSDARDLDPSKARMVGQEGTKKRSDLLAMGFDPGIVDSLGAQTTVEGSEEEISRDYETNDAADRSQDDIKVREAFIKLDYHKNGRSELRQIISSGNHILSDEPADRQPFHIISPSPLPHKHFGLATADKVIPYQDVTTALERQTLDNLYQSNAPEHGVWEDAMTDDTMDDLLTRRVGSVNRFSRPVGESYMPMTVPFTAGESFRMIDYFNKRKQDRVGISSDGEGLDPNALKNIQSTVMAQASDLGRMKQEAIARIFAETGIKTLFLHIHELVIKYPNRKEVIKIRGEWVPINPTEWKNRYNMTVNIGLGVGSREANLVHLNSILALQTQIIQNGGLGLLVTPDNIWNTAREFVKNANLKEPEMFFTDPQGQQAPPQSSEQTKLIEQQQQLEARQQELDAAKQENADFRAQVDAQDKAEKLRLQEEKQNSDAALELKQQNEDLTVEMEKLSLKVTELELEHGTEIEEEPADIIFAEDRFNA